MSFRSLTETLTLYRSGMLTLEQTAKRGNCSAAKIAIELHSRGITVREESWADEIEQETI